jgi:hypothetical protein
VRDILSRYGPPLVGAWRTRLLVMRSRLKSAAYHNATKLGLQARLINKRNRPLNAAEMQEGRRILSVVRHTRVFGLDGDLAAPPAERPLHDEAVT